MKGVPALSEVLRQTRESLASLEPLFWEDKLEAYPDFKQTTNLYVNLIGNPETESHHALLPDLLLDTVKPVDERNFGSSAIPEFRTVTSVEELLQRPSNDNNIEKSECSTNKLSTKRMQIAGLRPKQSAPEPLGIRSIGPVIANTAQQSEKCGVLNTVLGLPNCSVAKHVTSRPRHSAPGRVQNAPSKVFSLHLNLGKGYFGKRLEQDLEMLAKSPLSGLGNKEK